MFTPRPYWRYLRPTVIVVLLACALAPPSFATQAPAALSVLVLHRTDVPHSFRDRTRSISIASAASSSHTLPATLRAEGWLAGYLAEYQRPGDAPGVHYIASKIASFATAAGAHWYFLNGLRVARQDRQRLHSIAAGRVGSETSAIRLDTLVSGVPASYVELVFREGRYLATVTVGGLRGQVPLADATRYARIVDGRIRRLG